MLFDERTSPSNLPKAEAAARKLRPINSRVTSSRSSPTSTAPTSSNCVKDADLILDGTDNFEVRYLINDAAVKLGKPWVYGGSIGSHGQTMTILPGETPCLRCVFEAAPAPGEAGTCETAGVLGPIVNIIASFQAAEAFKILCRPRDAHQSRADLHRRLGEHQPADQDRSAAGQGRLPLLPAAEVRVARRRTRLADDEPVRPQRRAGGAPRRAASSTSRTGRRNSSDWAR